MEACGAKVVDLPGCGCGAIVLVVPLPPEVVSTLVCVKVHGQSVTVRVVGAVTVMVLLPLTTIVVGYGQ